MKDSPFRGVREAFISHPLGRLLSLSVGPGPLPFSPAGHHREPGCRSLGVALTCMLFHAASPRPRTQLSSLSREPTAPCFVSTHSPVPTLRIWMRKGKSGPMRHLKAPTGALAGVEEGAKAETPDRLSPEPPNEACPGWWQCLEHLDKRMLSPWRGAPLNAACPRACSDSGEGVLKGLPVPTPREFDPRGPGIKF